jgi:hypothetical protein
MAWLFYREAFLVTDVSEDSKRAISLPSVSASGSSALQFPLVSQSNISKFSTRLLHYFEASIIFRGLAQINR